MTTGEIIYERRKRAGMTQEELAEKLGVSRQAVSKWEQDAAFPETEKIVELCRLFDLSADELLLGETPEPQKGEPEEKERGGAAFFRVPHYEYVSKARLFGLPLLHVHFGFGICRAKGIFAVGNIATGLVSVGAVSAGLVSVGAFSIGLLAFGAVVLGLLSLGAVAFGIVALGGVAVGVYAFGGAAVGYLSFGGAAVGRFAAGDWAHGYLAIGRSHATGENAFLTDDLSALRVWLDANLSAALADRLWSMAQLLLP